MVTVGNHWDMRSDLHRYRLALLALVGRLRTSCGLSADCLRTRGRVSGQSCTFSSARGGMEETVNRAREALELAFTGLEAVPAG